MARKVLISFLGTGRWSKNNSEREYDTTIYQLEQHDYETSIVAIALQHFLNINTLFIFGTMGSAWEALYLELTKDKVKDDGYANELFDKCSTADYQTSLDNILFNKLQTTLGHNSVICPIKYGLNETEIKDNFNLFANALKELKDGDEIYLDISNSFRSLPLLATTALSYIQDVSGKKVKLKGIYYGMFEAKNKQTNKVPIVNLNYISQLQDWIKGAHSFMQYGNGYLIGQLLREEDSIMSEKITDFSNAININYLYQIEQEVKQLSKIKFDNLSLTASLVVPQVISQFVDRFKKANTQAKFQLELCDWHRKNRNYSSSFIVMVESILTYACEQQGWDWQNETKRKEAKKIALRDPIFRPIYGSANEIRNSIAHNIRKSNSDSVKSDVIKLGQWIDQLRKIY